MEWHGVVLTQAGPTALGRRWPASRTNFGYNASAATRIFDNLLTIPFAAFMSIWGTGPARLRIAHIVGARLTGYHVCVACGIQRPSIWKCGSARTPIWRGGGMSWTTKSWYGGGDSACSGAAAIGSARAHAESGPCVTHTPVVYQTRAPVQEGDRPEWYGTQVRISPVTGKEEVYYPKGVKRAKMTASFLCILLAVGIVLMSATGAIVYRVWVRNEVGECFVINGLPELCSPNYNVTSETAALQGAPVALARRTRTPLVQNTEEVVARGPPGNAQSSPARTRAGRF